MTTAPMTPEDFIKAQEAAFAGAPGAQDAFARSERKFIGRTKILETAFMPADVLERRQIDASSEDFKTAYPYGLMALHIAIEGVSVKFVGTTDGLLHLWIPMMEDRPEKYGQRKGRRSNLHIVSEAFESVWKLRPFGAEAQARLINQVAEWGQHLGDAEIEGDKREWAWDIPRKALPANFTYEGPVTEINIAPRVQAGGAAAIAASVQELSEPEAISRMVAAVVGVPVADINECATRILNIQGLPGKWNQLALEGTIMRELGKAGYVTIAEKDGQQVVAAGAVPEAVAA